MLDPFSDLTTVEALNRTREGIVDPRDEGAYVWTKRQFPMGGAALQRWDPWVRNYLMQGELLSGLVVQQSTGRKKPKTAWELSCTHGGQSTPLLTLTPPSLTALEDQIKDVLSYAALRQDRNAEILSQIDGQLPFWQALFPVRLTLLPWLQEILTAVTQFAVFVELRLKHEFASPRPLELSPQVQPMISTPGHGTFPMGHATQIYAVRHVLRRMLMDANAGSVPKELDAQMSRVAFRMSENRIVAGVHFPVDLVGGAVLGTALGAFAHARFTGGLWGTLADPDCDLGGGARELCSSSKVDERIELKAAAKKLQASPILQWVWSKAKTQLKETGGFE